MPSTIYIGLNHIDSNAEPYFYIYSNELSRAVSWEYGTQECRRYGFQQPTRFRQPPPSEAGAWLEQPARRQQA